MVIIDAHQDLAWNILAFGRDYTRSVAETRLHEHETQSEVPLQNGDTLLGWPDFQKGSIAVIFSTLFSAPSRRKLGSWDVNCYEDENQAAINYKAQLDVYHNLVDEQSNKFQIIRTRENLQDILKCWNDNFTMQEGNEQEDQHCIVGLVILMEGAEGIREPAELENWWERGVRLIGPAWAGTRFCGGTGEPGPMTSEGFALLEEMANFGFGLDLSHMDEKAALQALDSYPNTIISSHANALALLHGSESNRHLSDRVIHGILDREGVMGIVPYNRFLSPGWEKGDDKKSVRLTHLVNQIDYICQLAGDAQHVGIGSDFDGGFGYQSVPWEINTIADLQKIVPLLADYGYEESDIAAILGHNWQTCLENTLPKSK
jgi:membrane dipeptidase